MDKERLIYEVAKKTGLLENTVRKGFNAFIKTVQDGLVKDGRALVWGLGCFRLRQYKARLGRDPRDGRPVPIPPRRHVKFICRRALRETLNGNL